MKKLKNKFLKIRAFISYQYNILSKFKKNWIPGLLHPWIGSKKKNKSVEPNDCRLWTEPRHFKCTLPQANTCIYLNGSAYPHDCGEESDWFRIQTSELSLISSKTWALPSVHLCEEVDLLMPLFVTRVIVSAPRFLFFLVEPIHGWSTHGIHFFFKFWKIYWYEMKVYILKKLFLSF